MKGKFITFEGPDGCGKTTQIKLAAEYLRNKGIDVVLTKEPGDTPMGAELRRLLLNSNIDIDPRTELLMFLADRSEHVAKVIKPALEEGKWVLCDRYTESTAAYQHGGRGVTTRFDALILYNFAEYGLRPDHIFMFAIPLELANQRLDMRSAANGEINSMDKESTDFHANVHREYEAIAKMMLENNDTSLKQVDASSTIDDVQILVNTHLDSIMHE